EIAETHVPDVRHGYSRWRRVRPPGDIKVVQRDAVHREIVDHGHVAYAGRRPELLHQRVIEARLRRFVRIALGREIDIDKRQPRGSDSYAGCDDLLEATNHEARARKQHQRQRALHADEELTAPGASYRKASTARLESRSEICAGCHDR